MPKRGRQRKDPGVPKTRTLSVMVLHRTKDTMELVASVKTYQARLAAALGERYTPTLVAGEELPNWDLMLTIAVRDVQAALARLVELDDQVDDAEIEQEKLRGTRYRMVKDELYPRTVTVRAAIDLAFGRGEGRHIHCIKGRTPRKAPALERQLRRTLHRLTNTSRGLPPPKNRHANVDRDGWVRQLESRYLELVKLNRQLGLGEKALTALHLDKQAAMDAFDASYGDGLRYVQAVFRMARFETKEIKRLRPYYLRRRLSKRARLKREARAATAATRQQQPTVESPVKQAARVNVPKTVAMWLEKSRMLGT